jgi:hypothetical protein
MRDSNNGFSFEMTAIKNGVISYGIPRIEKGTAILRRLYKKKMNDKLTSSVLCNDCCSGCGLTGCPCNGTSCLCSSGFQYMTALSNTHVIKKTVEAGAQYIIHLNGPSYIS